MEANDQKCKSAKMEKFDLSLNTYVQDVEDFKFWVIEAGLVHRTPEKEIVKWVQE